MELCVGCVLRQVACHLTDSTHYIIGELIVVIS